MRHCDLKDWAEYKELVGSVLGESAWGGEPENYWYRGQHAASWPLCASFDRMLAEIPPASRRSVHQTMIDGLKERLEFSEDPSVIEVRDRLAVGSPNDSHEVAALAQHYGAPTRMLDWSESPYIAVFFALTDLIIGPRSEEEDDLCGVVALNTLAAAWNSDSGVELVRTNRRANARLRHQRGVFTLNSSTFSTLEEYCSEFYKSTKNADTALVKITLPKSEAPAALRELEMMGISSESMFPGLEGTARYAFVRAVDRHIWRAQ